MPYGGQREQGLVQHELGAEAAADRRADDLDLVLGQPDHAGNRVPDEEGRLGRAVDGHPGPHRVGVDQGGVGLDVGLVNGRRAEHPFDDRVRFGEAALEVAALEAHRVRHVGRGGRRLVFLRDVAGAVRGRLFGLAGEAVRPDGGGRGGLRLLDRHYRLKGFVVDEDGLGGIGRRGFALGENEGDRVADEDRPLARQQESRPVQCRHFRDVRGGRHGDDARQRLGGGRVDAQHLGVSVRAGDQTGVEQPGPVEVAAEPERALDLGLALEELGRGADRRHALSPCCLRGWRVSPSSGLRGRLYGTGVPREGRRCAEDSGAPRACAPRGSVDARGPRLARLG